MNHTANKHHERAEEKQRNIETYKKGTSHRTSDREKPTETAEVENHLYVLPD